MRKKEEDEKAAQKKKRVGDDVSLLVEDTYSDFIKLMKMRLAEKEKKDRENMKRKLGAEFEQKKRDLDISYKQKMPRLRAPGHFLKNFN